jgi:hypothetical protein
MNNTVADLIAALSTIENKDQPYIGNVYIAEDFTYETSDGEEQSFTPEQLAKVMNYRGIEKSLGFFYDEVYEHLHDLLNEKED